MKPSAPEPNGLSAAIGVVVVTHNSAGHISSCLRSLESAAPGVGLGVIVVDNASNDGTPSVARAARADVMVVENSENVGFARAVNQAVRLLPEYGYLLLLNPDAAMKTESLAQLLAALEAAPLAAACGPHLLYPDGRHQISARPLPTMSGIAHDALLLYHLRPRPDLVEQFPETLTPTTVDCLSGACMLIRRRSFDAIEGLDERFFLYGEDVDFCARLRSRGSTLILVPQSEVIHIEGGSAFEDRRAFFREIHRARSLYARKHFAGASATLAITIQLIGLALRGLLYPFGFLFGRSDLVRYASHQWSAAGAVLNQITSRRRIDEPAQRGQNE